MNNQKFVLINKSTSKIYYRLLTDTNLYDGLYFYEADIGETVKPNFTFGRGEGVWEYQINKESPDSSLHIFVIEAETLTENLITKEIIAGKKYVHYQFTVKQLDEMNWIFTYPC